MLQTYDERNRDIIVNINGALVPRDEAGVSPFDSTVQNGDGVWEGLRLYDGRVFRLHEHLARLRRTQPEIGRPAEAPLLAPLNPSAGGGGR